MSTIAITHTKRPQLPLSIGLMLTLIVASMTLQPVQAQGPVMARNVVFVHGAWADGSSWSEVIPILQKAGLRVTAVQNPLTSLADSAAATRRAAKKPS